MITTNTNIMKAKPVVDFAASALGIVDDLTLNICHADSILDHFSTDDYRLLALLDKSPLPGTYTLYMRTDIIDIVPTIVHEMVHLKQYNDGRLSLDLPSRRFTWEGHEYDSSFPYHQRPWEKEAEKLMRSLARDYKQHNKRNGRK